MKSLLYDRKFCCPSCKSFSIVLVCNPENISNVIVKSGFDRVNLASPGVPSREGHWICKNCYDVGKLITV